MAEAPAGKPAARGAGTRRIAVVGVSESATCGVRDHGELLIEGLADEGVVASSHWLTRRASSLGDARAEFLGWTRRLSSELLAERPEAVVLQYSVFSYSYRGLPLFVRPALAAARASGAPLLALLHEYVYPWGRSGLKGSAWAITQRAALRGVIGSSSAVLVTAPQRAEWLASRRWLPEREIGLAPVYSNLPAPHSPGMQNDPGEPLVGLFGYAYEGAASALVLDALALLHARGVNVRLRLLGAPGPASPAAAAWRAGAAERGLEGALSFSGVLPAQELSDALARCDLLLHPEPSGPTSRKGTLAGSLASGTAVVAIDGPRSWRELIDAQAALVVAPDPAALADGIAGLLADPATRAALGARGGEFARTAMGVPRTARAVVHALEGMLAERSPRR
ncbi:MAG TPA: glycosyltransferase [Solirubrobacteraceae bacterium]|nr:glycosyltransferase [Solirubrobacteraceae bacterium]